MKVTAADKFRQGTLTAVKVVGFGAAGGAVMVSVSAQQAGIEPDWWAGVVAGVLASALIAVWSMSGRRLGRWTAAAAVTSTVAVLFAVLALLSPSCPGRNDLQACTKADVGSLMMFGSTSTVVLIGLAAAAAFVWRRAGRVLRSVAVRLRTWWLSTSS